MGTKSNLFRVEYKYKDFTKKALDRNGGILNEDNGNQQRLMCGRKMFKYFPQVAKN